MVVLASLFLSLSLPLLFFETMEKALVSISSYLCQIRGLGERGAVGELRPRLGLRNQPRRSCFHFRRRGKDGVVARGSRRRNGIETLGHALSVSLGEGLVLLVVVFLFLFLFWEKES